MLPHNNVISREIKNCIIEKAPLLKSTSTVTLMRSPVDFLSLKVNLKQSLFAHACEDELVPFQEEAHVYLYRMVAILSEDQIWKGHNPKWPPVLYTVYTTYVHHTQQNISLTACPY